jgi:hypothetical protein
MSIQRVDNRMGGAYLPKFDPITPKEVKEEYSEQVQGLRPETRKELGLTPITRDDIDGVCECGYVRLKGMATPIPRKLLTKEAGISVPRKFDWRACDACVNGWGFDMCGCGSRERYDKCDGLTDHCGAPNAIGAWSGYN